VTRRDGEKKRRRKKGGVRRGKRTGLDLFAKARKEKKKKKKESVSVQKGKKEFSKKVGANRAALVRYDDLLGGEKRRPRFFPLIEGEEGRKRKGRREQKNLSSKPEVVFTKGKIRKRTSAGTTSRSRANAQEKSRDRRRLQKGRG